MPGGRPKIFEDAKGLQACLDEYKAYLKDSGKPPTIAGLAYYTGLDRQTIYNYQKRDEFFDIISKFRNWVIMTYEEVAIDKGGSGVIFLLKNYGYTDKQETEISGKNGGSLEIKIIGT